jgi:NitT/TauT family transport system permease protein
MSTAVGAAPGAADADRAGSRTALLQHVVPWLAFVLALAAWEGGVRAFSIPQWLLPAPSAIASELLAQPRVFAMHALVTSGEIVLGFLLSVAVGIPLAFGIAYSKVFERTLYPLLVASQAVPKVAIAPLLIVWFGFGTLPKVIVAFLIAFFPIVIDTVVGLRSVQPEMLHLARSMGATGWQTFRKIRLPKALPSIFAGFKVAITLSVVGAIVGEFVAADRGLGYLLMVASGEMNSRLLFAAIIVLTLIGVAFFLLIEALERWCIPWHAADAHEGLHGGA